jgi:hypothetical protein
MVSQVVKGLRQTATERRLTGAKAKAIHQVADDLCLYRSRERMRYDHYLANGGPIASCTVEGACKNLIRDRFDDQACAGPPKPQKPCCNYAPPTSPTTSTLLGTPRQTRPATPIPQELLASRPEVPRPNEARLTEEIGRTGP